MQKGECEKLTLKVRMTIGLLGKTTLRNAQNLSKSNIIKIFYHGLNEITQEVLNATPGGIFLYKTPNQAYQLLEDKVLLKLDRAKNQKTKSSLKKTVAFTDEDNSNFDIEKIMARMDAMTIKMDDHYKELQSRAKQPIPNLDDDDIPMSREEEDIFMQTLFIQAQLNNLGREIKKANEKVYATQVGCKQFKGPHYTKGFPLKEEGKTLEEAYYMHFGGPFQGGGYRAAAPRFYQRNNVNPSYQERRQSMKDTLSNFISESAKRHEENSNSIKEIRALTNAAI
nr:reverse transcriptase domain-containing protein [Tanacetum cinerariifolium]